MEEFDSSTINSRSSSEPIMEFSVFIEKLSPILSEMKDSFEVKGVPAMQKAVESLETDYNRAKSVMDSQNIQTSSAKHERLIQNLGRSLGLVLFASHDVPMANKEKIEALCKEMMNLRFDYSSDRESEFADEEVETEDEIEERQEEEIVEEETRILTVDDAILQIKYGNEEKFKNALLVLNGFVKDGMISHDRVIEEDVVKMLSSRLSSCKGKERAIIVQTLRHLILQNDQHKKKNGKSTRLYCYVFAISNGDDPDASHDARMLLNVMSGNTQHALHMAEAGYFKPLVKYLKEGSEMSKVLMATALSRLELTDQNKASLGEDGAIEPLVKMFNTGNLEAKLSALNALQSLSTLKQNIQRLIDSGICGSIVAAPILRHISSHDVARTSISDSSKERDTRIRTGALRLVYTLTKDLQEELMEQIGYEHVHVVANVVSSLTSSECEKTAALGILSNLPVSDGKVTDILKNANLLPLMVSILSLSTENSNSTPTTMWLAESIASILIRFTVPTDKRLQHYSVENGVIPVFLKLLSRGSETAKRNSALCLTQLSQNSLSLSKSRKLKWFCMPPSADAFCSVHDGYCSVKNTFCLVKAGAVSPLIRILEGTERGADEAVLSCLSTLLQDEIWENGCNFLARTSAVRAVIRVLTYRSLKSREKPFGYWKEYLELRLIENSMVNLHKFCSLILHRLVTLCWHLRWLSYWHSWNSCKISLVTFEVLKIC
ncbi:UNVERIFIED_CONTAM: hypothetical protein Slati_0943200 [Sesamum latifolium]|uniref:Uncharacterized protein n=1 Tax=Sesamum latifolium TaxID=2727402 RepID=A0AAW2XPU3_9LAMI